MNDYLKTSEQVLQEVNSTPDGLTEAEAAKRLAENGKNKLAEPPKKTFMQRFLGAINDPMIIMLLGAALLSTITTVYQNVVNHANESYADLIIILFVVIVNTLMGIIQESPEGNDRRHQQGLKRRTAGYHEVRRHGSR